MPVVVWGALVDLVYLVILLYVLHLQERRTATFTWPSADFFVVVWVLGVIWYFFWKQRSKAVGRRRVADLRRVATRVMWQYREGWERLRSRPSHVSGVCR